MLLAKLIDQPERAVKKSIAKLEELSGFRSEDVRFLARSRLQLSQKLTELGLDPHDTTGEELYQALQVKLGHDLDHAARAWGIGANDTDAACNILAHAAQNDYLAIKNSSLKVILKALPPKKTQKLLGYRSIDSMLKRETTANLLAVALSSEGLAWQSRFATKVGRLKTSDYEIRTLQYTPLSEKSAKVLKNPAIAVPLNASVLVNKRPDGLEQTATILLAMEAAKLLSKDDRQLKAHQFSKDFNKIAERIVTNFAQYDVADDDLLEIGNLNEVIEEPYSNFCSMHPAFSWWKDAGQLAHWNGSTVSLHLTDNVLSRLSLSAFENRYTHNLVESIKSALAKEYLKYQAVKDYFRPAMDDTFISLENVRAKELVPDFDEIRNL